MQRDCFETAMCVRLYSDAIQAWRRVYTCSFGPMALRVTSELAEFPSGTSCNRNSTAWLLNNGVITKPYAAC